MQKLQWTRKMPSEPGWYLYQLNGQWPIHSCRVAKGSWRQAQDPEKFYASGSEIVPDGSFWVGPLEEPNHAEILDREVGSC